MIPVYTSRPGESRYQLDGFRNNHSEGRTLSPVLSWFLTLCDVLVVRTLILVLCEATHALRTLNLVFILDLATKFVPLLVKEIGAALIPSAAASSLRSAFRDANRMKSCLSVSHEPLNRRNASTAFSTLTSSKSIGIRVSHVAVESFGCYVCPESALLVISRGTGFTTGRPVFFTFVMYRSSADGHTTDLSEREHNECRDCCD